MSSSAAITGTSYDLLALKHPARTSASPVKSDNSLISAASKRSNGGSVSIGLDATGNVITTGQKGRDGKTAHSSAIDLFG